MTNTKLCEFYKSIENKTLAFVGIGVSNLPLIKKFAGKCKGLYAYDKKSKEALGDVYKKLENLGVNITAGENYLDDIKGDIILKSPGIRSDNSGLVKAEKRGALLTSEMELFFELCPCKIIGITGSDGKTTTTTLISKMLEKSTDNKVYLGGNIGTPLLPKIDEINKDDIVVVELSSFQLMTMKKSPNISVITNLSPNHLDMHKSMDEYIDAKKNIFKFQNKDDILIINSDNKITNSFENEAKGKVIKFSLSNKCGKNGVCFKNDALYYFGKKVIDRKDILLKGMHNVDNYLAAISAVYGLCDENDIKQVAKTFGGVCHRMEFIRKVNNISFYNDSIGSSPTRTTATLRAFDDKVILIAGGYDKKIPFDDFGYVLNERVKTLILTGHTAEKIKKSVLDAKNYNGLEIILESDLKSATQKAYEIAKENDIILLSPACASFDAFKNFEERGNTFVKYVMELK